jgi:glyoxylase-like metal-dependent hydrolase (beta-lactamase superfamily II)
MSRCLSRLSLMLLLIMFAVAAHAADPTAKPGAAKSTEIRLYAIDCGRIDVKNMGAFADTGEYDDKPGALAAPCFVIRHPKGVLLWDSGLGDKIADSKGGIDMFGGAFHLSAATKLADQLKAIGLTPADITFVAFSHMHFDHTGNANQFGRSTFILNSKELAWGSATPAPFGVDADTFSVLKSAKTQMIDGDHDVFDDGRVLILKAPGHTPGHDVLLVKLAKSGPVLLSGDLYHTRANRQFRRVPAFNDSRPDTLAYIDRIETIVRNLHARFVIQHDLLDFAALPKFPLFLD